MKNIAGFFTRLACAAALFAAASCSQEVRQDSVRMSDTAIVLEDGELSYQFEVVANAAWTLTCMDEDGNTPDWFSVTPSSGNGTTKVTLNIVKENPDMANRTGKVVAVCGDKRSEASVTQRGVPRVISFIDPQVVAISSASAASGRFSLVLSSKGATVTAKLPSDASWLSNLNLIEDVETGFSARKTWTFDVAPNNMSDMRSAVVEVTVSAKGKTDRYSVRVEQSGQGVPAIKTPDVVYMGSNQSMHTQPFWVDGSKENLTYQISFSSASMDTGEPWIKEARVDGDNLVIVADPNTSSESREGSVYIVGTRSSAAGSGASTALSVKVFQAGHSSAGIQMAASEVSVGYAAASHFVSFVLLNGSRISGSPEANVPWITGIKASEEGRLNYSVSEYNADSAEADYREGIISFKVGNGASNEALASLKVRQYSSKFADIILPMEISLPAKSASEIIPFDTDGGSLEVVPGGCDWLKATCTESESLSFINVSADDWMAGDAGSSLRSGLVALKYTRNGRTVYHYINVYQYAPAVRDIAMPEALNFDYDEETSTFAVGLAGGRIGEIMCSSAGDWLKSASVKASGDYAEIAVKVDKWTTATDGPSNRIGTLCVPYIIDGLTMYHYIQVSQKSQAFKDIVLPDEVSLPAKWAVELVPYDLAGGSLEVVKSDVVGSWLSVVDMNFDAEPFLLVSADDWQASDADSDFRSGLAVLKYSKNGMSACHYITVKQFAPKAMDTRMPTEISLNYDDMSASFMVALNGGRIGSITCSSEGGWIKSAKARNEGNNAEIVIEAGKWTGSVSASADRTGILCIPYIYDGLTMYHYVMVSQKPEPFNNIHVPQTLTLRSSNANLAFYLDVSKGEVSGISSSAEWLNVRSISQNGVCSVDVVADGYTGAGLYRSCVITIPYRVDNTSVTYHVTVTQYNEAMSALTVPPVISLSHAQTSADVTMMLDPAALAASTVGQPMWASDGGWLTDVTESALKLALTAEKWDDSSATAAFRQGNIVIPYTRSGVTVFYYSTVYQYSKNVSGLDIPSSIFLKPSEMERTISIDRVEGSTLSASYDAVAAPWIQGVTVDSDKIVVNTSPGTMSVAGETSRSAVISFTYVLNGISTVYNMTVTQELADADVSIDVLKGFRHYYWWYPEETDRGRIDYSSFAWLDRSARTLTVGGSAIGLPSTYDFKAANTNVQCSLPGMFESVEVTEYTVESDHVDFKLAFHGPDFSAWSGSGRYTLTFNVGEGKTFECEFNLDVYDHRPERIAGLEQIVPDAGAPGTQHDSPYFKVSDLAAPEGERYAKLSVSGLYADEECTISKDPSCIYGLIVYTDKFDKSQSIVLQYHSSHPHEEGFLKLALATDSGKTEYISVPYRLYSRIGLRETLPPLNKVAFSLDELVQNADDWKLKGVQMSTADPNNGKVSVTYRNERAVLSWTDGYIPSSVKILAGFSLRPNSYGDTSSDKTVEITLDYQKAPDLLPGDFSIGTSKKVRFTRSNLTMRFVFSGVLFKDFYIPDYQLDLPVGDKEGNTNEKVDGNFHMAGERRDLFRFSVPGSDYGTAPMSECVYSAYEFVDWGQLSSSYFSTSIAGKGYRTLEMDEWDYLANRRNVNVTSSGTSSSVPGVGLIKVDGRPGWLLLPDNFVWNELSMGKYFLLSDTSVNLTAAQFTAFEYAGAVWLPAAGYYYGEEYQSGPAYWSSTCGVAGPGYAWTIKTIGNQPSMQASSYSQRERCAVRLVKDN